MLYEKVHYDFYYDKKLGRLIRNKTNKVAGTKCSSGYRRVLWNKKSYQEHRLIWFYHYGYFPENQIDHIDRDPSNNHIENLREATHSCNARNTGLIKTNTSGVKGVSYNKERGKYIAQLEIQTSYKRKNFYLGLFDDFEEAVCHRLAAEQVLDWAGCDASSPAFIYVRDNIQWKKT